MDKVRLATVWLGGCSGCHMSFLDLDDWLFDLAKKVALVYSPFVDTKEYPENVDIALVEGAIANEEHLEMIWKVRDRSRYLIAFGDCAVTGNVTAMRNPLTNRAGGSVQSVLDRAYLDTATHPQIPTGDLVPSLVERVMPVHQVVPVNCYLPGCPPNAARIRAVLTPLLSRQDPQLRGRDFIRFG